MRLLLVMLGFFAMLASPAAAKKLALVIGNDTYQHIQPLQKAAADARAYVVVLREKGFGVTDRFNLDRAGLDQAIAGFIEAIAPGDTAVLVYSGHGWSDGAQNFILGIDAPAGASPEFLARISIPLKNGNNGVIDDMERRGAALKVAIIDACRDNPFAPPPGQKGYGLTRGLAPMQVPNGTFVVYSAAANQTALDRLSESDPDPNSVFSRVFLPLLRADMSLQEAIKATQIKVVALAGTIQAVQKPAYYDEVIGNACLSGECRAGVVPVAPVGNTEQADFAVASLLGTVAGWDGFLAAHGSGALADYARGQREKLTAPPPKVAILVAPPPVASGPCGGVVLAGLSSRAAGALSRNEECALKRGDEFRECKDCPPMVVLPPGSFTMGSPAGEEGRFDNEGPQHVVSFASGFAVGKFQVTRDEFSAFVNDSGYDAGSKCYVWTGAESKDTSDRSWKNPGFAQTGTHPAACLNWNDASAYAAWLSKKTGQGYRLLSESEWEYAARGQTSPGNYPRYFFGDSESDFCRYGNGADATTKQKVPGVNWTVLPCDDKYAYTSPVGSFSANGFGLFDMHGNVWQWTQDCWNKKYDGSPANGSPWTTGDCSLRVLRGGSWGYKPTGLRAAFRGRDNPASRNGRVGSRLARTLLP